MNITETEMLNYLQEMLDDYMRIKKLVGDDDELTKYHLIKMTSCKDMVEVLIGEQVNLQLDGKVTVGL